MPSRLLWLSLLVAACGQSTQQHCMTVGGRSDLVTQAALLKLEVYDQSVPCDGPTVAPGTAPLLSHTFKPGDVIKLDIPPGKRTLVLVTYADAAGTVEMGTGCTTQTLAPGAQVCVSLTLMAAPDQSVPMDLAGDAAKCSLPSCCTTAPDDCPSLQWCNAGTCESGCKADSDCAGMPPATDGGLPRTMCNTATHQCVACTTNTQCPLGQVCSPSGACVVGCDASHGCPGGLSCCNNLCVDTTSDPLNCGSCNGTCGGNTPTCCASACVSTTTNVDHCGGCGRACSSASVATRACAGGVCTSSCVFGHGNCSHPTFPTADDGCETNEQTITNCGGCNVACNAATGNGTPTCWNFPDGGTPTCVWSCNAPWADCNTTAPDTNGCETDTSSDVTHCGGCINHVCNTTNNTGTACNGGVCQGSCLTNRADCDSDPSNLNVCETTATTTQHCGTCTGCVSGGIVSTSSCWVPDMGQAFCTYTCSCGTSGASSSTCDGTTCSYTCNTGKADCNAATAPNTDGCECTTASFAYQGTAGCCGTSCQVQHDTGLSTEHWYDCTTRDTYTSTEALAACLAHTHDATKCSTFTCTGESNDNVVCDNNGCTGGGSCTCNCWDFAVDPKTSTVAAGRVDTTCFCPGSGSAIQWH